MRDFFFFPFQEKRTQSFFSISISGDQYWLYPKALLGNVEQTQVMGGKNVRLVHMLPASHAECNDV